jgi:hypothetical protein
VRMILQVAQDSLCGYLVAWERKHMPEDFHEWEFLAFTGNMYNAKLVQTEWNRQCIAIGMADNCPACKEEIAYIFGGPYYEEESTANR